MNEIKEGIKPVQPVQNVQSVQNVQNIQNAKDTQDNSGQTKNQSEKSIKRKTDTVDFSKNAQSLIEQFHNAEKNAEATADSFQEYIQCLTIASRIIAGDNVPVSDQQFLQEKEPDLFFKASMLRQKKSDPKDYDSVLSDDEDEENSGEISAQKLDSVMENSADESVTSSASESSEVTTE